MAPTTSPNSITKVQSRKNHYHAASSFFVYCKNYVEERAKMGRKFCTERQGFEAAALEWNSLSEEDKENWRRRIHAERKKCNSEGSTRLKIRNGDRGDPNADPSELGRLKELALKSKQDIKALNDRWTWLFKDITGGIDDQFFDQHFLIISAKLDSGSLNDEFVDFAVVDMTLRHGIIDLFHFDLSCIAGDELAKCRYAAVGRAFAVVSKINRRLGANAPIFFAPKNQLAAVFHALTYVGGDDSELLDCYISDNKFSLTSDLATIWDLRLALYIWFGFTDGIEPNDISGLFCDNDCALTVARTTAEYIFREFQQMK